MYLYHVTTDLKHKGEFTPRVPENIDDYDEEDTIPRICVATSIEGALSSVPWGGDNLENELQYCTDRMVKVFQIPLNQYRGRFLNTDYLNQHNFVPDAWATGECWLLDKVKVPENYAFFLKIESFALQKVINPQNREDIKYIVRNLLAKPHYNF